MLGLSVLLLIVIFTYVCLLHSIVSGLKHHPGIFIERVRPGSLGEEYGLEVGDQILEVNGRSFLKITHNEAILCLKESKDLNIVIKKKAVSLSCHFDMVCS